MLSLNMEEKRTPLKDLGTFAITSTSFFITGSSGKTVASSEGSGGIDDGKLPVSVGGSRREDESMASNDPT